MNEPICNFPKRLILGALLVCTSLAAYPQTFAASTKYVPMQRQRAVATMQLRDAILLLNSRYHVNILFEEKLLEGFTVSDSLLDLSLTIESNLAALLAPHNLEFKKMKKNAYVIVNESLAALPLNEQDDVVPASEEASTTNVVTNDVEFNSAVAIRVSGTIRDENGEPMPGVNVVEKGTVNGTTTDLSGKYSLAVDGENSVLVFSFIGYTPQEVRVGSQTTVDVSLQPDVKSLSEVVVIGYGERERKDITGSVSDISSTEIVQTPTLTPQLAMQGRMPGVLVTGAGGDPNARPNVSIRGLTTFAGSTQPLYVIDGIPVAEFGENATATVEGARAADLRGTVNIFTLIDPNDIESISVLKDASSAAIYGVRGANGVVLITTKRGKQGKPKVDFSASYGVRNLVKELDVVNTQEYTSVYRQAFANDVLLDQNDPANQAWLKFFDQTSPSYQGNSPTYDWQDALINRNAPMTNYSLGISGGSEFSNYNIGAGYSSQEGSLKFNRQERYSFSANSDFKIRKWLEVGETFRIAYTNANDNRDNTGVPSNTLSILSNPPWQPIYDPTAPGGFAKADAELYGPETGINFVGLNTVINQKYDVIRTLGSGYLTLIPFKGFRVKGALSVDYTDNKRTGWAKNELANLYKSDVVSGNGNGFGLQNTTNYSIVKEVSVSYNRAFGEHNFDLLLNASDQQFFFNGLGTGVNRIPLEDPDTYTISAGDATTVSSSSFKENGALQGYLGRLSYKFRDKYYVDASLRRDGSFRFAPENRWANFFSISGAWRLSAESFLSTATFIDDLKLRGGWGQLGNQDIRPYSYLSTVSRNPQYGLGNTPNGSGNPNVGAILGDFPNRGLKWEKVETSNIAVDASLFKGALTTTIEYYSRRTSGVLQYVSFPASAGLNASPVFNIGKVLNKGFEFSANYNRTIGDFQFSVGGNITTVNNEVLELYNDQTLYNGNLRVREGRPINSIYGYQTDGIFQTTQEVTDWLAQYSSPGNTTQLAPGDFRFRDIYADVDERGQPDGIVNGFDQTYLGKTIPGYYYGITLGGAFRNFDLSILFQGVGDVQKINQVRIQGENMGGRGNNLLRTTLGYWTPENRSNTMPRPHYSDASGNNRFSDRWVEDAGFLRLNNLQLGYSVPQALLSKIGGVSKVRIYAQSNNTFFITNYTGLDPENDLNPTPRTILFGLNASF